MSTPSEQLTEAERRALIELVLDAGDVEAFSLSLGIKSWQTVAGAAFGRNVHSHYAKTLREAIANRGAP